MQIKYNLTEEDYLNFNIFHVNNSKLAMSKFKRQRFLIPLLLLIVAYVFADALQVSIEATFIVVLFIGILWMLFYPRLYYGYITQSTRKMITAGRVSHLLGEHNMLLNKDGIVDSAPKGETRAKWANIYNFIEDDHYFYIYITQVSAIIVPKRSLKNVEEIGAYIRSKVNIKDESEQGNSLYRFLKRKIG